MKKIVISLLAFMAFFLPVVAFAQLGGGPRPDFDYANDFVDQIILWSNRAVTFLMVIATLWFIYTVIKFITAKEAKDVEERKKGMVRGIIGLAVIVGIWGIVSILTRTFGVSGGSLNESNTPCPPGMRYDPTVRSCI